MPALLLKLTVAPETARPAVSRTVALTSVDPVTGMLAWFGTSVTEPTTTLAALTLIVVLPVLPLLVSAATLSVPVAAPAV